MTIYISKYQLCPKTLENVTYDILYGCPLSKGQFYYILQTLSPKPETLNFAQLQGVSRLAQLVVQWLSVGEEVERHLTSSQVLQIRSSAIKLKLKMAMNYYTYVVHTNLQEILRSLL